MKKICCDMCGKEYDVRAETPDCMAFGFMDSYVGHADVIFNDVCPDCREAIKSMFATPIAAKRPKTGSTPKIDRDAVISLRNAGWSIPKIATELKCSKSAVGRILQIEKEAAL